MANKDGIASNIYHIGNSKFMILISFWFVFLYEGIFSTYYCDMLTASLEMWSNEDYGSPTGCYDSELFESDSTAYTETYNGMTLIELTNQCSAEGGVLILIGAVGIIVTFGILASLLLNVGTPDKKKYKHKTYFNCNYYLAHLVSMPILTIIVGVSQGIFIDNMAPTSVIAFVFRQAKGDNTLYYWQLYFSVNDCNGLWDDMYEITSDLVVVLNIAYFAFIFYGFLVPFFVMIMYMVRGKMVFNENEKYHCLAFFRLCHNKLYYNDKYQSVCNYCDKIFCVK